MPIQLIFWGIMIVWLVTGLGWAWPRPGTDSFGFGNNFLIWVLFFCLGWKNFGFIIQG